MYTAYQHQKRCDSKLHPPSMEGFRCNTTEYMQCSAPNNSTGNIEPTNFNFEPAVTVSLPSEYWCSQYAYQQMNPTNFNYDDRAFHSMVGPQAISKRKQYNDTTMEYYPSPPEEGNDFPSPNHNIKSPPILKLSNGTMYSNIDIWTNPSLPYQPSITPMSCQNLMAQDFTFQPQDIVPMTHEELIPQTQLNLIQFMPDTFMPSPQNIPIHELSFNNDFKVESMETVPMTEEDYNIQPVTKEESMRIVPTAPYQQLDEKKQAVKDDDPRKEDWKSRVGAGLTELLYPFNDCIILETDAELSIIDCETNYEEESNNKKKQQTFFDYPLSYLKKHTIDLLLTEKCKSRVFRDRKSNSYQETIIFCGDIIYIKTGSKKSNRKWISLWVKEKKNNSEQITGYMFIFVDNCISIGQIKMDDKGMITSFRQAKKENVNSPYDLDYFIKYPQNMIKGMSYHQALGALDKPLITFHGLHYFISKPDDDVESNVLDIVAIDSITGMVSISWEAESFLWSSETISGCLFGETEDQNQIVGKPVKDRLPQVPYIIQHFHQVCPIISEDKKRIEEDYHSNDIGYDNMNDTKMEPVDDEIKWVLHGSVMTYVSCKDYAKAANVLDQDQQFIAISKDQKTYTFEHMSIQHSYDDKIPHWVFLKYKFTQKWSTNFEDYIPEENSVGRGSYGITHAAKYKNTNHWVTIKTVLQTRVVKEQNQKKKTSLPMEIEILKRLQQHGHHNCCSMLMYHQDQDNYYIVMENYGKTLYNFIEETPNMDEPTTRSIFKQIANAVHHLHTKLQVIHRDIKDENVMIDNNNHVRLIDFGSAAYIKTSPNKSKIGTFNTFVGTIDYASPEVLSGNRYTGPPQDIWALGVLLYTIVHHSNPFHSPEDIVKKNLVFPFELPKSLKELIDGMLESNVDSRFAIQQVVNHEWLSSC